jgi:RimJ/RimL family protein N-acetyltransferase
MTLPDGAEERLTLRELMVMHVAALFTLDAAGRMLRGNEPSGKAAPRFFLGRTLEGNVWRFRHDQGDDVVQAIEALCRAEIATEELLRPPYGATQYRDVLERFAPVERVWTGPAYRFPPVLEQPTDMTDVVVVTRENADVLRRYLSPWLEDVAIGQPLVALLRDGHAVSVCCSVRLTDHAYEAGVETHPEFRGQGFAPRVVSAWGRAVRAMGRIPLYSTSWENLASRAVAAKVGLVRYGTDLHIT